MAEISFGGLATGLPTEDLIESLMAVERRPVERLQSNKKHEALRLQAYQQLDTRLENLRSAVADMNITSEVRTTRVRLNTEDQISASSSGASTGRYEVAVAQLAQVQKTVMDGLSSDASPSLGTGTFFLGDVEITVDSSNNSLAGLRDAINGVSDQTGVTAAIINDGNSSDNYHLVLTGDDASTSFTAGYTQNTGTPVSFDATNLRNAQQAIIYVDGIEVVSDNNTITGVIAGVTINLNDVSDIITPATETTPAVYNSTSLNVEADTTSLKEKITSFVTSYNEIMDWISAGYEAKTTDEDANSTDTGEEDILSDYLRGDATVNDIKRNLQNILSTAVGNSGGLQILSEIGISTQKDGSLYVNNTKLDKALDTQFDEVVTLLAGSDSATGVMKSFNSYLQDITSASNGMYAEKKTRFDSASKRLDGQISQKELMMEKVEAKLRAQFTAMELLVSNLNAQGDYLTQQMEFISNIYNQGN